MRTMSRGEIHRRSGFSLAHISKIYGGSRRPSLTCLEKLAEVQLKDTDEVIADIAHDVKMARKRKRVAA